MKIYFGEMQVIEGKATGFTNGAIESAIIHCRALLEFLILPQYFRTRPMRNVAPVVRVERGVTAQHVAA